MPPVPRGRSSVAGPVRPFCVVCAWLRLWCPGLVAGWVRTVTLMTKRDFVAAYRVARAGARRTRTARLRRQERRVRETVAALPLDEWRLARLAAVRHELRERGVELPPIRRGLP